jgi:hypothetical protein
MNASNLVFALLVAQLLGAPLPTPKPTQNGRVHLGWTSEFKKGD